MSTSSLTAGAAPRPLAHARPLAPARFRKVRLTWRWLIRVVTGAIALFCLAYALLYAFHLEPFVMLTGSMGKTIPVGSLVVDESIPPTELKVGDVMTFQKPIGEHGLDTHRITAIQNSNGHVVYLTKGDANPVGDPWAIEPLVNTKAHRVVFTVPYVGWALLFVRSPTARKLIMVAILLTLFSTFLKTLASYGAGVARARRAELDGRVAVEPLVTSMQFVQQGAEPWLAAPGIAAEPPVSAPGVGRFETPVLADPWPAPEDESEIATEPWIAPEEAEVAAADPWTTVLEGEAHTVEPLAAPAAPVVQEVALPAAEPVVGVDAREAEAVAALWAIVAGIEAQIAEEPLAAEAAEQAQVASRVAVAVGGDAAAVAELWALAAGAAMQVAVEPWAPALDEPPAGAEPWAFAAGDGVQLAEPWATGGYEPPVSPAPWPAIHEHESWDELPVGAEAWETQLVEEPFEPAGVELPLGAEPWPAVADPWLAMPEEEAPAYIEPRAWPVATREEPWIAPEPWLVGAAAETQAGVDSWLVVAEDESRGAELWTIANRDAVERAEPHVDEAPLGVPASPWAVLPGDEPAEPRESWEAVTRPREAVSEPWDTPLEESEVATEPWKPVEEEAQFVPAPWAAVWQGAEASEWPLDVPLEEPDVPAESWVEIEEEAEVVPVLLEASVEAAEVVAEPSTALGEDTRADTGLWEGASEKTKISGASSAETEDVSEPADMVDDQVQAGSEGAEGTADIWEAALDEAQNRAELWKTAADQARVSAEEARIAGVAPKPPGHEVDPWTARGGDTSSTAGAFVRRRPILCGALAVAALTIVASQRGRKP
jgi:signal peptidase